MLIGLTGKSCSGKNIVSKYFSRKGFEVWDLDREAEKIRKEKRSEVLAVFGTTDSKKLASIVFSDSEKLKKLEQIIYPQLVSKIKEFKYDLVINGATLKHAGLDSLCSLIIYVDVSYETRLKRACERDGISEAEFSLRDAAQSDVDFRKVKYDCPVYPVDNEKDCTAQLDEIFSKLIYTSKP